MKYDYKVIEITKFDSSMKSSDFNKLQEWFDKGWEYVETLQQKVTAAGQTSHSKFPSVGVILRREVIKNPLD